MANGAVDPVVDIGAADSGELDIDKDIVGRFDLRDWALFELDAARLLKDEREVL